MIEILKNIWSTDIRSRYLEGRITTERGLQSNLYAYIFRRVSEWKVFVEPGLYYPHVANVKYKPDLVICDSKNILAIIEIKFVPHHYPYYKPDINKMIQISKDAPCKEINLEINPNTGKWTTNKHSITEQTNFIFMVVGQADSDACNYEIIRNSLDIKQSENMFWLFYGKIHEDNVDFGTNKLEF